MSSNISQIMFGPIILILFNFVKIIAFGVMIVYGFILLVKFLRAGTKAFNIYIEKNINSNLKDTENEKPN